MNTPLPEPQHFTLLDMATGQRLLIPLAYREGVQAETLRLMLMSHNQGENITYQSGTDIFADLSNSGNGIATLSLTATVDMCGGRIRAGDPVYTMVCAVSPRMEQVAWGLAGKLYISVVSQNPLISYASLGDIPDSHPWVAGFPLPCVRFLGDKGKAILTTLVRQTAATLVNRCIEVFVPNPEDSLLRDAPDAEDI